MPENELEKLLAIVTAGLAKEVEEVKKYAAPIQAATRRGIFLSIPCFTARKIMKMRPADAILLREVDGSRL